MRRCPVCEKEQLQGPVCDNCCFDLSCDYEGYRTLCSALPGHAEPVSVRTAKWKQQQTVTETQGTLVCSRCGGKHFSFLINEQQFVCADCETIIPVVTPKDRPALDSDLSVENKTPDAPPVTDPAPAEASAAPAGIGEEKPSKKMASVYGTKELTAIICTHCWLVNPDNNYVCDHCAKRLWQYSDPNAPKNVFLFGFRGFVRRYDHIKVDAASLLGVRSTKPYSKADADETQPALQKKSQSGSAKSMTAWGRSKEEREKIDRAFDILTDKS